MDSSTKLSMFNINSGGYLLFPIYTKYKDLELEHLIINAGNGYKTRGSDEPVSLT